MILPSIYRSCNIIKMDANLSFVNNLHKKDSVNTKPGPMLIEPGTSKNNEKHLILIRADIRRGLVLTQFLLLPYTSGKIHHSLSLSHKGSNKIMLATAHSTAISMLACKESLLM